MANNLNVSLPTQFDGNAYSWDTSSNSIAKYNYPKLEPQHLDYILLDRDHAQPSSWHNDTHRVKSPEWSVKSWEKHTNTMTTQIIIHFLATHQMNRTIDTFNY